MKLHLFQSGYTDELANLVKGSIHVCSEEPVLYDDTRELDGYREVRAKNSQDSVCYRGVMRVLNIDPKTMPEVGEYITIEVEVL